MTVWIVTNGSLINSVWNSHGAAAARADSLNENAVLQYTVVEKPVQETG